jgi:hypothetical protein
MAARGDSLAQVRAAALDGAPAGARLDVAVSSGSVTATVRADISPPGPLSFLPGVAVQSHVVEAREPVSPAAAPPSS